MSNKANLANGYINGSVSAGATSLDLKSGYAGDLPAVPFSATLAPYGQLTSKSNSEIVTVTGVSSDTLTIVRGQRGTNARSFADGDVLAVGVMVEDVVGIDVTVATARTTAAKIGTTADGNYVPCYGDKLNVTFTAGCYVNTPTLNIDGSGAKNIRMADVNVETTLLSTGAVSVTLPLWFDGTYYQMYGSMLNTDTTYTEITEAEIDAGTASTSRTITGRRVDYIQDKTLEKAYPVNSIYISTISTNPNTLFGFGTWVAYGEGRVIVGKAASGTFSTAGATGGAETHTLTTAEIPSHTHPLHTTSTAGNVAGTSVRGNAYVSDDVTWQRGGGGAHNNLQPYIVAYMWHRTA